MTRAESQEPDRAFPGADSAVPGEHTLLVASEKSATGDRNTLPLERVPMSTAHGWSIRLPVRAEQVMVTKDVVVATSAMDSISRLVPNTERPSLHD